MTHGYENTNIDEIRNILKDQWQVTDEEVLKQTKIPLVKLLLAKEESSLEILGKALDDAVVEEDDNVVFAENLIDDIAYGSPQWSDYVLRQFTNEELDDGNPKCDGCRRVVEQLLGPIVSCGVADYTPASIETNGTATVLYTIEVAINNDIHPLCGQNIILTDIADVGPHNTEAPYSNYAAATAATRAEGRCYRKLLRLTNVITAEEKSDVAEQYVAADAWSPDNPIDDNQINVIDIMCRRLNISVIDFINSGVSVYPTINHVTKSTAQKMLQELNNIQRKTKDKPKTLGGYVENWREFDSSTTFSK